MARPTRTRTDPAMMTLLTSAMPPPRSEQPATRAQVPAQTSEQGQAHGQTQGLAQGQEQIQHRFSQAAPHYQRLAQVQHHLGEQLWQHCPPKAQRILDLGCGPGHWTARLAQRYPNAHVTGVDLSPGMLTEAKRQWPTTQWPHLHWQHGDAQQLPTPTSAYDLIFSNLALQWCSDLQALSDSLNRTLAPNGQALIHTLLPGTFHEIEQVWQQAGRSSPVRHFFTADDWLKALTDRGFQVNTESFWYTHTYPDIKTLLHSIRGVGAQTSDARHTAITPAQWRAIQRHYHALGTSQGLPISYHLLYLKLHKPSC